MSNRCPACGLLDGVHVVGCRFDPDQDFKEFMEARVEEDAVNHPPHYTKGKYETIDVLEDIIRFYPDPVLASQVWQVLKYLCRAPHKHDLFEDLGKARWYLERALRTAEALESDREPC